MGNFVEPERRGPSDYELQRQRERLEDERRWAAERVRAEQQRLEQERQRQAEQAEVNRREREEAQRRANEELRQQQLEQQRRAEEERQRLYQADQENRKQKHREMEYENTVELQRFQYELTSLQQQFNWLVSDSASKTQNGTQQINTAITGLAKVKDLKSPVSVYSASSWLESDKQSSQRVAELETKYQEHKKELFDTFADLLAQINACSDQTTR